MGFALIIDDSLESLASISTLFHSQGLECRIASSWKLAIDQVMIDSFDFILCEYNMDGGDAFWFFGHLKRLNLNSKFFIMSDDFKVKDMILSESLTVGFCHKPILWDDLRLQII